MNIFRKQYRELSVDEKALIEAIKTKAEELYALYPQTDGRMATRELSLAATKLEESIMWAVKSLTA